MRVLVLSPYPERLTSAIEATGDEWRASTDPLSENPGVDFIISYGYRHLLREPLVSQYAGRAINLHISMLPWNRGADPNLWSWIDGTPKGVTIHLIDAGLDTGPILTQRAVSFAGYPDETLASSYARLQCAMEILFRQNWPAIRARSLPATPQQAGGSYHRARDKEAIWQRLPLGYATKVADIAKVAQCA